MQPPRVTLAEVNAMDQVAFVSLLGPCFEHSPWVAAETFDQRPFDTCQDLHQQLVATMLSADHEQQLALLRAHPDLVGRLAREGRLTEHSAREQAAAGLDQLTAADIEQFERYNQVYRERFGFPFIICARENRRDAILSAFPRRLRNTPDRELHGALQEVARIAWWRLIEKVRDDKHA